MAGPLAIAVTVSCTDTSCETVVGEVQLSAPLVRWDVIVGIDRDAAPTLIECGFSVGGRFIPVVSATPGAAARSVNTVTPIYLPSSYLPAVRFWGATENHTLEMYAFGESLKSI